MNSVSYPGNELELFRFAQNWKGYFSSFIKPYIQGDVLEIGAGMGGTSEKLMNNNYDSWTCVEPDHELAGQLDRRMASHGKFERCNVIRGTVADLNPENKYDVILYIDVLEHIEDDFSEIAKASTFLKTGGFLVILAPAHQWLYSEFDRSIGHFRRYNSKSLTAVIPADYTRVVLRYLDSAGIFASLLNRILLHKTVPTPAQIRFWDKVLVTVSRISDPVLLYLAGKSIIGVWQKN